MANVKFSALPNATTLTGTEQSVTLQGGVASLVTPAQTATYLEVTQSPGDASTLLATDAFVANAIATVNPASSVDWATAAVLPNTPTYNNGTAGVGATLTSATNTTLTVDSNAVALNDRVLVKNQAATFQNGVYYQTQVGTGSVPWILTRAIDYNTANNINYTGTIPVIGGTTNALTNWLLTSFITAIGSPNAITYTQQTTGGTSGGGGSSNIKGKPPFTKGDMVVGLGGNSIGASGAIVVDGNASANIVPGSPPATTAAGYLGAPINEQDGDYTFVLGDAGYTVRANISGAHTYTIPTNASVAYPLGTIIVIRNGAGSTANLTLSPAGGVNLYQAGLTFSASLTLGAGALVTLVKEAINSWMATGVGNGGLQLIAEVVTSGSQASVTFSAIPGTFRDLVVRIRGRSTVSATVDNIQVQFNGDTGANYDNYVAQINGASTVGVQVNAFAQTVALMGYLTGNTGPSNAASASEFVIYDYRGTTFQKAAFGVADLKLGTSAGNIYNVLPSCYWRNTAAITSVKVFPGTAFVDNSVVSLYGSF